MLKFVSCITLLFVMGSWSIASIPAEEVWPGFRGWGNSVSEAKNLPRTWELRGRSRGWTTRLPGYGQSSPVVWKEKVFVTSVSGDQKEHLHISAIHLGTGEQLWQKDFAATQKVRDSDTVTRGAPTPVVDAERLYVAFESGDIIALSHTGEILWQRSFVKDYGEIMGPHGYSSSPILADDLLIAQVCHNGPSYLLACDTRTGQNRWKIDHPSQTGWSSPVSYRDGHGTGIIASTAGSVRAYDAKTGREWWHVTGIQGNSTASPTVVDNLVVIGASERGGGGSRRGSGGGPPNTTKPAAQESPLAADPQQAGSAVIRLGGSGDVTQTHVVWRSPKITTGYSSPLVYEGLAYFTNKVGALQCVNLLTGEIKWHHRLPGQMWASAIASDGHLFFFCKEGEVAVLKAGPVLEVVGENSISVTDIVYGVAAVDNAWLVRSGRSLVKVVATTDSQP
ncbi:MAG: Pyrrolo-quinoline quinone [Planctomycetaceae bacterium]|nr:Pyrrolo-quinoline quinone [Planctomycetaceae bacterium]